MTRKLLGAFAAVAAIAAIAPASGLAASTDLAIDKTDSVDPATVGVQFSYNLKVTNNGPDTANGVVVEDTVPNSLTLVGSNPTQGSCKQSGRKLTCTLGTLANGASASVTVQVVAKKAGQIVNTAKVSGGDPDPVAANDTDSETTNVVEPPPAPLCAGQEATIVGTEGDDSLTGTNSKDVIVALGGNDTVLGIGGNDIICTAAGNDIVKGAGGSDQIRTGGGDDVLKGGDKADTLRAGGGNDRLSGGRGADTLRGGGGKDVCSGGGRQDVEKSC